MIGAAIDGREAGHVHEGDRRFAIMVLLAEPLRSDVEAKVQKPLAALRL